MLRLMPVLICHSWRLSLLMLLCVGVCLLVLTVVVLVVIVLDFHPPLSLRPPPLLPQPPPQHHAATSNPPSPPPPLCSSIAREGRGSPRRARTKASERHSADPRCSQPTLWTSLLPPPLPLP